MNKYRKLALIFNLLGISFFLNTNVYSTVDDYVLSDSTYEVFIGDYDGDLLNDIYLKPISQDNFVTIPNNFAIINASTLPQSGHLVLKQETNGSYTLITDPDTTVLLSINLIRTEDFEFYTGDFNGDGINDTFIRSLSDVSKSFVLAAAEDGSLSIVQQFTIDELSFDITTGEILIADQNNDGRTDITRTLSGEISLLSAAGDGNLYEPSATNDDFTPSIPTNLLSQGVGAIDATFSVSSSGKPNYVIPFRMLPGIAGIAPDLSLVYSGQASDGILGVGWYLSGLSEITRCTTRLETENYIDGVNFNSSDKFCLNGQRLVLINGNYGAPNSEYRTESESYSKIIFDGSQFTVSLATGEIETYGGSANSKRTDSTGANTYVWKISKREDRESNYATYSYLSPNNNEHYINEIQFNANADENQMPTSKVGFFYETRNDVTPLYTNSITENRTKRLDEIQILLNDALVRKYDLNYSYSNSTSRSQLQYVTDCAVTSGTEYCLPDTTFVWGNFDNIVDFTEIDYSTDSSFNSSNTYEDQKYHVADVNGDGRSDVVWTYRYQNTLGIVSYFANSSGAGFENPVTFIEEDFFPLLIDEEDQDFLVGDFNGDGLSDFLYVARNNTEVYRNIYLAEKTEGNVHFIDQGYQVDTDSDYASVDISEFRIGDFNGDGRSDLAYIFSNAGNLGASIYLSNLGETGGIYLGKTNKQVFSEQYSTHILNNHTFQVGDVNGDGKSDLVWGFTFVNNLYYGLFVADDDGAKFHHISLGREQNLFSTDSNLSNAQLNLGDINGDGKSDLVWTWVKNNSIESTIFLSDEIGNSFTKQNTQTDLLSGFSIGSHFNQNTVLSDLNADGRSDLIYLYNENDRLGWKTLTANMDASGFTAVGGNEINGAVSAQINNHQYLFGDITLDGRPDLIWAHGYSSNDQMDKRILTLPQAYPDHITTITNGLGVQTKIQYAYLADAAENIYTKDNTAQYPLREDIGLSFVVKNIQKSNGIGGFNSYDYQYEGARTHLRGRGFLGFKKQIVDDNQTNFVTTQSYSQKFPLIGRLQSSVTVDSDTTEPVRKIFNHWKVADRNWSTTITKFPYLKDTVTINYEVDGGEMSTSLILNNYNLSNGNLNEKIRAVGYGFSGGIDGSFDENGTFTLANLSNLQLNVTTTNSFLSDLGANWRPGFLERETQVFNSENDSTDRTIITEYDPYSPTSFLHGEERRFVGSDIWIKNIYNRDNFGNVTQTQIEAADIDTGSIGIFNELTGPFTDGLYPDESTNHLTHTERFEYDKKTGLRQEYEDVNGLKTYQFYDDFGRVVISRSTSGAITTNAYTICDSSCPTLAVYKVSTTVTHPLESGDGAPFETTYYDIFNRELKREYRSFQGGTIIVDTEYDNLGRVRSVTEPYFSGATPPEKNFTYDDYNRVKTEIQADGGSIFNVYTTDASNPNARNKFEQRITVNKNSGSNQFSNRVLTTSQWSNSLSQIRKVIDAENITTELEYDAQGNVQLTRVNGDANTEITVETNIAGLKERIIDPDMGEITFEYDGRGSLRRQTHVSASNNHVITTNYDALNRITTRLDYDGTNTATSNWSYDSASNGIGLLDEKSNNGFSETYAYDLFSRLQSTNTSITGLSAPLVCTYQYDGYSRPTTKVYPSGFSIRNSYNSDGYLNKTVNAANNKLLWQASSQDARQNYTQFNLGNGLKTIRNYDVRNGYLLSTKTGTDSDNEIIQNLNFEYDTAGNLYLRNSQRSSVSGENITETFQYDDIHRLTNASATGLTSGTRNVSLEYNSLGNILTKSDVSNSNGYTYAENNAGIHAVTKVTQGAETKNYSYDFKGNMTGRDDQLIDYAVFNKITNISSPSFSTQFQYNPDRQRFHQSHTDITEGTTRETFYLNQREFELVKHDGLIREKSYVGNTLVHSKVRRDGETVSSEDIRYLHQDHLGSTESITNSSGNLTARLAYDTHGRRLDSSWERPNSSYEDTISELTFEATSNGYTGHEMLADSGLVHMNGRVYDPYIGRFTSPDVFVQFPNNSQSYNRYTYVHNNPLSYTDPSGNIIPLLVYGAVIAYKAYNVYDTATSTIDNFNTLTDPNASTLEKASALADSASALAGVPKGLRTASGKLGSKFGIKSSNKTASNAKVADKTTQPEAKGSDRNAQQREESQSEPVKGNYESKGIAIIREHKIGDTKHYSVEIKKGAIKQQTHQVHAENKTKTYIVDGKSQSPGKIILNEKEIEIPDSDSAIRKQNELLETGNLGQYDTVTNSCITHVCDVLRAGGIDVPDPDGSAQVRAIKNIIKE